MLKQIYRFLSIALISNILVSPAVFSKTQTDTSTCCCKPSIIQRIFRHKKSCMQNTTTPSSNQTINLPKPNPGNYVTKYGIYYPKDIYDSYPTDNK